MINPNRHGDVGKKASKKLSPIGGKLEKAPAKEAVFDTLESCEQAIVGGFQQIAEAMARIREGRLYEQAGFTDFGDYCEQRRGIGREQGDRLASAHFTLKSLPGHCRKLLTNESQAREVAKIPEEKRVKVIKEVAATGPVTAKRIRETSQPPVIDIEPAAEPKISEPVAPEPARPVIVTCSICRQRHDSAADCPSDEPAPAAEVLPEPQAPVTAPVSEGESNEWWIVLPAEESAKLSEMMATFGFSADEILRLSLRMFAGMD